MGVFSRKLRLILAILNFNILFKLNIEFQHGVYVGWGIFYPKKVIQKKLSANKSRKKIYPEVLSNFFIQIICVDIPLQFG